MASLTDIDPYAVLDVAKDANLGEIRIAHRKKVLKCHPDKIQDESQRKVTEDLFYRVQQAYSILSDETERARYDQLVKQAQIIREQALHRQNEAASPRDVPHDVHHEARVALQALFGGASVRHQERQELPRGIKSNFWPRMDPDDGASHSDSSTDAIIFSRRRAPRQPSPRRSEKTRQTEGASRRDRYSDDPEASHSRRYMYATEVDHDTRWPRSPRLNHGSGSQGEQPGTRPSQQGPSSTTIKKEEFMEFFLGLLEEVCLIPSSLECSRDQKTASSLPDGVDQFANIEEQIKERNKAVKDAKADAIPAPPPPLPESSLEPAGKGSSESPPAKEKLYVVPPEQLNLEVMYSKPDAERVDIVAVHGLGAIPDITWREKESGINWLADEKMLPAAAPKARILRFGYDSLWMGDTPIRTTLSTISTKLLLCLNMIRAASYLARHD
ncbi:hypothetical protein N7462_001253 [Penicillium macrosclerotiorum]|uniref:uncharacterized protein n=1 Tax=Penicillium macrosclerotiorum TaxID=303699 RepID=UPI002546CC6C|nr:uncharacterized protein N7462_001253 [Penicillium macrosclerotiorum]KAJ5691830.1 hypothetical protein N7462_001253 [Penicillium macrosclerotiorum]